MIKRIAIGLASLVLVFTATAQTTTTSSTAGGTTTGTSTLINQGTYDTKSLVDTNSTSNSTSTVTSNSNTNSTSTSNSTAAVNSTSANTNTNNRTSTSTSNNTNINKNENTGTMTYNNNNVSTSTATNNNNNVSTSTATNNNVNTGDMTNRNINNSTSTSTATNNNINQNNSVNTNIQQGELTNKNINQTEIIQRVIQPPPTAVAPAMLSGGNADLCSTGSSGSVQTQVFGVSSGGTVRDMNCERLKLSKTLYDMGMKVAAVATMCQDRRVFDAMLAAGTPCPYEGKIGEQAKASWDANPDKIPKLDEVKIDDTYKKVGIGAILGVVVRKLF
jgi:hypothetical protein